MDLNFSFSFNPEEETLAAKEKQQKAQQKKKASEETLKEAFVRVMSLKNSDSEIEKIKEVFRALHNGEVKRSQNDLGKRISKAEISRLYSEIEHSLRDKKIRELVKKTPFNYILVNEKETFERLLSIMKHERLIAIDTETTGVDVVFGMDTLVGISLTTPLANTHWYIPIAHDSGIQLDKNYVLNEIKPFIESEKLGKILHNAKFDYHVFRNEELHLKGIVHDTMIAQHILNENENDLKLKNLVVRLIGESADTFSELFGKDTKFNTLPLPVALVYAAKDTDVTYKLYLYQMELFKNEKKLKNYYDRVENPLIEVLAEMERTGFTIDDVFAEKFKHEVEIEVNSHLTVLDTYFPDLNINSTKQLSELFYDRLKLGKHLPKGVKPATDAKTLKLLEKHHRGIEALLKYKEVKKLHSTYLENLPKMKKRDGKIHPSFGQTNTVSGRLNSSNPNFQNLDPRAKEMFVAPEGYVILSGDFS